MASTLQPWEKKLSNTKRHDEPTALQDQGKKTGKKSRTPWAEIKLQKPSCVTTRQEAALTWKTAKVEENRRFLKDTQGGSPANRLEKSAGWLWGDSGVGSGRLATGPGGAPINRQKAQIQPSCIFFSQKI